MLSRLLVRGVLGARVWLLFCEIAGVVQVGVVGFFGCFWLV